MIFEVIVEGKRQPHRNGSSEHGTLSHQGDVVEIGNLPNIAHSGWMFTGKGFKVTPVHRHYLRTILYLMISMYHLTDRILFY